MFVRRLVAIGLKSIYCLALASIFLWSMPFLHTPLVNQTWLGNVRQKVGPAFRWSGLWQGWSMFAPNPSNQNLSVQVAIEFADGKFEFVTLPLLHHMTTWEAYRYERYRKFTDNLRLDSNSAIWPGVADYYYRQFASRGRIKQIELVRWWTLVPPAILSAPPPPQPTYMNFENSYIFHSAKYPL